MTTKALDLGWPLARLTPPTPGAAQRAEPSLTIVAPAAHQGGLPAQSILILGERNLGTLRDALNELLPPADQSPAPTSPQTGRYPATERLLSYLANDYTELTLSGSPGPRHFMTTARITSPELDRLYGELTTLLSKP